MPPTSPPATALAVGSSSPRSGIGLLLILGGLLIVQLGVIGAFVWARPGILDPVPESR